MKQIKRKLGFVEDWERDFHQNAFNTSWIVHMQQFQRKPIEYYTWSRALQSTSLLLDFC